MAITVLVLWLLTASAGARLLFTSGLGRRAAPAPAPAREPVAVSAASPAPLSKRDARRAERRRYDPPTLTRSRNEPMPGLKDLIEFAHPLFAITGLAFWLGYTMIHNRVLAWIAFGLVTATASLGLTWFTVNTRAASRRSEQTTASRRSEQTTASRTGEQAAASRTGEQAAASHGEDDADPAFSARLIAIHGAAAALTFALAALTALTAHG